MNEPPGARLRIPYTALTMAEYFRDEEQRPVLIFIDNIYRFIQAGSEVSALLGRLPSEMGYQSTLDSEMGVLQERITSTSNGSITSVQAVYIPPADDVTDPPLWQPPSRIWMPPLCFQDVWSPWDFIRRLTLCNPVQTFYRRSMSVRSITTWRCRCVPPWRAMRNCKT